MTSVFADTGYWIAFLFPTDSLHAAATQASLNIGARTVVTSEMVLVELLNDSSSRGGHARNTAARFAAGLYQDPGVHIIPQSSELFREALDLYINRTDKEWSLTDCASFLICEREGITEALAYDHHFQQAGITPLLRD